MPRVLAIEPNSERGATLQGALTEHVADVLVVDSNTSAIEVLRADTPDLILLSSLLSPADEDMLFDVLRELPHAEHVQTLHIPQLRTSGKSQRRSKFSLFRSRQDGEGTNGCSPEIFAREVLDYLDRASALKLEVGQEPTEAVMAPATPGAPRDAEESGASFEAAEIAEPVVADRQPPPAAPQSPPAVRRASFEAAAIAFRLLAFAETCRSRSIDGGPHEPQRGRWSRW